MRDVSCNVDLWLYVFDALFSEKGTAMAGSHHTTKKSTVYTQVGALIHRLRIDELPQLLNILRGEMSLVDRERTVLQKSLQPPPPQR